MSPDLGLGLLHVATGTFFTITGWRKTFDKPTHARVTGLFKKLGVGNPFVNWAVPVGELCAGLGILTGTLTGVAAGGALVITAGAFLLDTRYEIAAKQPKSFFDWIAKSLCTAEGQLIVVLATLILTGAGKYSIDHFLF